MRRCSDSATIALSARPELDRAAMEAGANGLVSKTDQPERLLMVLDRLRRQEG